MNRNALIVVLLLPLAGAQATGSASVGYSESTIDGGRYGPIAIYRPDGPLRSMILFISGDGGWHLGVVDAARMFAAQGALVAGIDIRRYFATIRTPAGAADARCVSLAGDLEALSQRIQRTLQLGEYRHPVLVGYSSGATLVYAALAQSPAGTFAGALSMGFCPDQDFAGATLCASNGLTYRRMKPDQPRDTTLLLQPDPQLRDGWLVAQGTQDQVCDAGVAREFAAAIPSAQLIDLPKVGHGFSRTDRWWPQVYDAYQHLTVATAASTAANAGDLPVTEVAAATVANASQMALMISGDGGWAGLDQDLSAELARRGIPVAGLSSLRYFWRARTPDETAADVTRLLRHYLETWRRERVLLIGYSFGADVMPYVVTRLPADLRARIDVIALLGPSDTADFEVSTADWLPGVRRQGLPTQPELARTGDIPVLCVHGADERDSLCPALRAPNISTESIGRGHHFGGEVGAIADAIQKTAARR